jgi:Fur family ferric uptake transcriptional regulator/Fur family peroxide stress response transcriptional regulator
MREVGERRMTPQRRAVLDVLRAATDHPTAAEIYDRVRAVEPGVGAATVYRSLGMLVQTGQASEVSLGEGASARYDARTDVHDHVVCSACGRAVDVPTTRPDLEWVARVTGFEITGYDTQFHGRCPACRKGRLG